MSGSPESTSIFYDQVRPGSRFDDMHLPQRPAGFSAYPLADKEGDSSATAYASARRTSGRGGRAHWNWSSDRILLISLTLLAIFTKLYRIGRRDSVSWDESHFYKNFSQKYLRHLFHHDVHPPLAKMLIALSNYFADSNGTYTFDGGDYPAYVNYTFMRVFNAAFGIALTPMAFLTCRQLRLPSHFAAMAALFVTLDNAICVMSRFILLDAPLLCFTALSLTMLSYFYRQRANPFSAEWFKYLILTGVALGLVSSSKWVGFFAIALVGLYTIHELYEMFCNVRLPVRDYAKHWVFRVMALLVTPLAIYMSCFVVHFWMLSRYDNSANFMPMGFQVRLRGNPLSRQPYDVQTGAQVRLYSQSSGTGYLHSHAHKYPAGSQRQQITGYGFADQNNFWNIERKRVAGTFKDVDDVSPHDAPIDGPIGNGDVIALHHNSTDSYLYAEEAFKAPISSQYSEVSAVSSNDGTKAKSSSSLWVVDIVSPEKRMNDGRIHPLGTPIRLRNLASNCILVATGERLDKDWGWGQAEVACDGDDDVSLKSSKHLWTIERNSNKNLTAVDLGKYMSTSFFKNFGVLNRQMWLTNNALIPDHDKHNVLESDPWSWPFMVYPMRMVGWDDSSIKYLEIGNPFLWWGSATVCLLFPLQLFYWLVCWQRKCMSWRSTEFREYIDGAMILWGGWALHYLPFFAMGRVTYIHHYLPALYFGILFLAYQIYNVSSWYLSERSLRRVLFTCATTALFGFWWFSPLTYGWNKPIADLKGMQWASSWPVYKDQFEL
ncbi:Protein O-mannosyltransferase 2 [Coemansia sp. RSA 922]|nr:Protein O-mannosyltransferase 2 [Coemansia sp. S680]KAJ2068654.1 Protein O-mannosyltransferase 2 [Coemansia sp. S155-1]KAJ2097250.1 Protein O-mannosyltransferase 2 [Coemansia sp. RSA 922]